MQKIYRLQVPLSEDPHSDHQSVFFGERTVRVTNQLRFLELSGKQLRNGRFQALLSENVHHLSEIAYTPSYSHELSLLEKMRHLGLGAMLEEVDLSLELTDFRKTDPSNSQEDKLSEFLGKKGYGLCSSFLGLLKCQDDSKKSQLLTASLREAKLQPENLVMLFSRLLEDLEFREKFTDSELIDVFTSCLLQNGLYDVLSCSQKSLRLLQVFYIFLDVDLAFDKFCRHKVLTATPRLFKAFQTLEQYQEAAAALPQADRLALLSVLLERDITSDTFVAAFNFLSSPFQPETFPSLSLVVADLYTAQFFGVKSSPGNYSSLFFRLAGYSRALSDPRSQETAMTRLQYELLFFSPTTVGNNSERLASLLGELDLDPKFEELYEDPTKLTSLNSFISCMDYRISVEDSIQEFVCRPTGFYCKLVLRQLRTITDKTKKSKIEELSKIKSGLLSHRAVSTSMFSELKDTSRERLMKLQERSFDDNLILAVKLCKKGEYLLALEMLVGLVEAQPSPTELAMTISYLIEVLGNLTEADCSPQLKNYLSTRRVLQGYLQLAELLFQHSFERLAFDEMTRFFLFTAARFYALNKEVSLAQEILKLSLLLRNVTVTDFSNTLKTFRNLLYYHKQENGGGGSGKDQLTASLLSYVEEALGDCPESEVMSIVQDGLDREASIQLFEVSPQLIKSFHKRLENGSLAPSIVSDLKEIIGFGKYVQQRSEGTGAETTSKTSKISKDSHLANSAFYRKIAQENSIMSQQELPEIKENEEILRILKHRSERQKRQVGITRLDSEIVENLKKNFPRIKFFKIFELEVTDQIEQAGFFESDNVEFYSGYIRSNFQEVSYLKIDLGEDFSISSLNKLFNYLHFYHPFLQNNTGVCLVFSPKSHHLLLYLVMEPCSFLLSSVSPQNTHDIDDGNKQQVLLQVMLGLEALHNSGVVVMCLGPELVTVSRQGQAKVLFPSMLKARMNIQAYLDNYASTTKLILQDMFLSPYILSKNVELKKNRLSHLKMGYWNDFGAMVHCDLFAFVMLASFLMAEPSESFFFETLAQGVTRKDYYQLIADEESWNVAVEKILVPVDRHLGSEFVKVASDVLLLKEGSLNYSIRHLASKLTSKLKEQFLNFDLPSYRESMKASRTRAKLQTEMKIEVSFLPGNVIRESSPNRQHWTSIVYKLGQEQAVAAYGEFEAFGEEESNLELVVNKNQSMSYSIVDGYPQDCKVFFKKEQRGLHKPETKCRIPEFEINSFLPSQKVINYILKSFEDSIEQEEGGGPIEEASRRQSQMILRTMEQFRNFVDLSEELLAAPLSFDAMGNQMRVARDEFGRPLYSKGLILESVNLPYFGRVVMLRPEDSQVNAFVSSLSQYAMVEMSKSSTLMELTSQFLSLRSRLSYVISPSLNFYKGSMLDGRPDRGYILTRDDMRIDYSATPVANSVKEYNSIGFYYSGELREGIEEGKGRLYLIDEKGKKSQLYSGQFRNGCPHGKGKFYNKAGAIFSGIFRMGNPVFGQFVSSEAGSQNYGMCFLSRKKDEDRNLEDAEFEKLVESYENISHYVGLRDKYELFTLCGVLKEDVEYTPGQVQPYNRGLQVKKLNVDKLEALSSKKKQKMAQPDGSQYNGEVEETAEGSLGPQGRGVMEVAHRKKPGKTAGILEGCWTQPSEGEGHSLKCIGEYLPQGSQKVKYGSKQKGEFLFRYSTPSRGEDSIRQTTPSKVTGVRKIYYSDPNNKAIYSGQTFNFLPHGFGRMDVDNFVREGSFYKGKPEGLIKVYKKEVEKKEVGEDGKNEDKEDEDKDENEEDSKNYEFWEKGKLKWVTSKQLLGDMEFLGAELHSQNIFAEVQNLDPTQSSLEYKIEGQCEVITSTNTLHALLNEEGEGFISSISEESSYQGEIIDFSNRGFGRREFKTLDTQEVGQFRSSKLEGLGSRLKPGVSEHSSQFEKGIPQGLLLKELASGERVVCSMQEGAMEGPVIVKEGDSTEQVFIYSQGKLQEIWQASNLKSTI